MATKEGLWSKYSIISSRSRINRCLQLSPKLNPVELFDLLSAQNLSLYSIKTTLITASRFERQMMKTSKIKEWLNEHAFRFRHCYRDRTRRMSAGEFGAFLMRQNSEANHNLLVLIGKCGLRKMEALNAKWDDFNERENLLVVIGKGGKQREVPLSSSWLKGLPASGRPIVDQKHYLSRRFIEGTGFGFHDFRAYFATHIANHKELGIKDAQVLLGHSSLLTTQRYVRVDQDRQRRILLNE